jgi:hypothetical protein
MCIKSELQQAEGPRSSYSARVWQYDVKSGVTESRLPPSHTAMSCAWCLYTLTATPVASADRRLLTSCCTSVFSFLPKFLKMVPPPCRTLAATLDRSWVQFSLAVLISMTRLSNRKRIHLFDLVTPCSSVYNALQLLQYTQHQPTNDSITSPIPAMHGTSKESIQRRDPHELKVGSWIVLRLLDNFPDEWRTREIQDYQASLRHALRAVEMRNAHAEADGAVQLAP